MPTTVQYSATIASSGTTSTAVNAKGALSGQLSLPSNFRGANVTFLTQVAEGGSFQAIEYDETGAAISVPVAASKNCPIPPVVLQGALAFKVVSDVAQNSSDDCLIAIGLNSN